MSIESKYGKDLGELRAVVARKPALSSRKIAFLLATEFGWHKKYGWPRTRDEGDPKNRIVALCEREGIALPLETGAQRKGPPKPPRAKAIGRGATLPPLASLQE